MQLLQTYQTGLIRRRTVEICTNVDHKRSFDYFRFIREKMEVLNTPIGVVKVKKMHRILNQIEMIIRGEVIATSGF